MNILVLGSIGYRPVGRTWSIEGSIWGHGPWGILFLEGEH